MAEVWPIVAATGHRPKDLSPDAREWLRRKLADAAVWFRDERGARVGISGMALGVDTWWAQAVLSAGLELHAYIPFPQQPDVWPAADRAEWERLCGLATRTKVFGDLADGPKQWRRREAVRLLHARNDGMLADSAALVSCLDVRRRSGGTWSATVKAVQRGVPGVHLDPGTQTVRVGLPDVRRVAA